METVRLVLSRFAQRDSFAQRVLANFGAQVISAGLLLLNAAMVARVLGTEGKGLVALTAQLTTLLMMVVNLGVGSAYVYYTGTRRFDAHTLVGNALSLTLLNTLIAGMGLMLLSLSGLLPRLLPALPGSLIILAWAALPLQLLISYFSGILQGQQRIKTLSALQVLQSAAMLLWGAVLLLGLHSGVSGGALAVVLAWALNLALLMALLRREGVRFRPRWDRQALRATMNYGLRGYIGTLLQYFNYRLDTFLVNYFIGAAQVGLYSVAVTLAELLWYLPHAVGFVIMPKAASSDARAMNAFTPRVLLVTLGLTLLGGLGLALVGPWLIRWIFSPAFSAAYPALLWLLPGVVLLGAGKVLTNEIAGRGFPHYNAISSAVTLLVTVALDLTLIPRSGIVGAAQASTVAYSLGFGLALFFYRRVARQTILARSEA